MIAQQQIVDLLTTHKIRKTPFRIELLGLFMDSKYGLSFKDVKNKITSTKDKVTIYRALDAFCEKGLIHKVPTSNSGSKYALCSHSSSGKTHDHSHVHFICNQCDNTYCLDDVELPEFSTIENYRVKNSKITLEGDCPDCILASNHT